MEKEKGCIKCGEKATKTLSLQRGDFIVKEEYFCTKHWVENEGEGCLDFDLRCLEDDLNNPRIEEHNDKRLENWNLELVEEIRKQFPKLANEYKEIINKIVDYHNQK